MKRRNFLSSVGAAVALPAILGNTRIARSAPFYDMLAADSPLENENILVVIQMNGGNDGLNTLIPLDYYDNLARGRGDVLVPENEIIKIEDKVGLHPSFSHLADAYNDAKLGVVQSVGYPEHNFSHFRATDIWTSGSGSEKIMTSGWLGRYLAEYHPQYPEQYPTSDFPDPLSLTIGSLVSTTCQGPVHTMGMAFNNFDDFYDLKSFEDETSTETFASNHVSFINELIEKTNIYTKSLENARDAGENTVNEERYPETNFGNKMRSVAHLINGGLKTKVYVVTLSGFDTHAGQVETEGESQGLHSSLLQQISHSIDGAYKDLKDSGNSEKVLFMTFTEFGRRIGENGSVGTDHGTSAPMFFMGDRVNPIIQGDNPVIPENPTIQDNLETQFDYRSVYSSILKDWFDVPETDVEKMSLGGFDHLPIILPKNGSSVETTLRRPDVKVFPNPAHEILNIESKSNLIPTAVLDINGRKVLNITGQSRFSVSGLAPGQYIIVDRKGMPVTKFMKR